MTLASAIEALHADGAGDSMGAVENERGGDSAGVVVMEAGGAAHADYDVDTIDVDNEADSDEVSGVDAGKSDTAASEESSPSTSQDQGDDRNSSSHLSQQRSSEPGGSTTTTTNTTTSDSGNPLCAEQDGFGMKGHLSMRDEGLTYHRMKRFYCRCVGLNFCRFSTREAASTLINAAFSAEIHKVESWDGKGLWHTYRNSFKLYFTNGAVFNIDADSEDDKKKWLAYIQTALEGAEESIAKWKTQTETYPNILLLSLGGLGLADKKHAPPKFKNQPTCCHPKCNLRFDSAKRQHHCRNCGGSVCSDHSLRSATLRHYSINNSVRLCTGCYRVQRFMVWLSMILQRLSIAQVEGVKKPVLSKADEEEVEALQTLLSDPAFGISDIIQVLHLHRHGCDEAYALAVNKLLELSTTNLPDFEFFLPEFFQLWLTVDWARNNIKAALLFRVVCYAAQLHIRFATSLYWLARAAVDDSCGWGFGQSELLIPEYLFRKFSLCKLLMINLEMQISQNDWSFAVDRDIPAPELQAQMIACQFECLRVLTRSTMNNVISPLGELCDAISACAIPEEYLLASKAFIQSRAASDGQEWRVFNTQIKFVEELCDMTERLRHCAPEQRKEALRQELQRIKLPEEAFCPLGSCEDALQRFITIARTEGTVFTTRARAPTLIFFEVEMLTYLAASNPWLQRARSLTANSYGGGLQDNSGSRFEALPVGSTGARSASNSSLKESKNAIEMATSSDIAQALELNTLSENGGTLSSQVASKADEDQQQAATKLNGSRTTNEEELDAEEREEARDRVPSNPVPVLAAVGNNKPGKKTKRGRSGSLVTTTTKSLDSIIAACSDTLNGRRKRSVSEGEAFDTCNGYAQRKSSPLFNEVEKFTKDQLIRMAQNLEIDMLAVYPTSEGVFSGKDVVSWMTQNEIVFDETHAMWLGGELIDSGAIETATPEPNAADAPPSRKFSASKDATYRLRSESTTILALRKRKSTGAANKTGTLSVPSELSTPASPSLDAHESISEENVSPEAHTGASHSDAHSVSFLSSPSRSSSDQRESSSGFQADTSNTSSTEDRRSTSQRGSFFEKFKPDEALSALHSVEDALQKHVFPHDDIDDVDKLRDDLLILKEQMEIIHEFVVDKQKQRHSAVESAFGESFEEKRERLRQSSRHLQLSQSSNWDCVAFIVKSNDDLRQEVLCLQLIRQFQDIFHSADLPLRLLPYGIIATSASTGMIEYVKNATSLDGLKKRRGYTTLANHFLKTYGDVDSAPYKTAMTNFVRSMAAYSLACYFLQIKDRHNGNIMIDSDGHVVHIDYGFILGIAPGGRFSLETAPFKLTAEMVEAMGGTQSEYFKAYVIFLIQGFLALQTHGSRCLVLTTATRRHGADDDRDHGAGVVVSVLPLAKPARHLELDEAVVPAPNEPESGHQARPPTRAPEPQQLPHAALRNGDAAQREPILGERREKHAIRLVRRACAINKHKIGPQTLFLTAVRGFFTATVGGVLGVATAGEDSVTESIGPHKNSKANNANANRKPLVYVHADY
ncbi:Atypical/pi3k/pi4k protein kinase, partial [Globisporangium splendens]